MEQYSPSNIADKMQQHLNQNKFNEVVEKVSQNRFSYTINNYRPLNRLEAQYCSYPLECWNKYTHLTYISNFKMSQNEQIEYFNNLKKGIMWIEIDDKPALVFSGIEETIQNQAKISLFARYPKLMGGLLCLTTAIATLAGEYTIKNLDLISKCLALFSYFKQ